jgi:regulator of protease activity HflC (stomatin/prohibitin superfamily)
MNISGLLQAGATLLWIVLVGLVILAVFRASRGLKVGVLGTAILGTIVAAIVLTAVAGGLVFVQPDERAVVISALAPKGYREDALLPGLHWIIPGFESTVYYPISKQTYTMSRTTGEGQVKGDDSITARTLDGQEIFIDASVIYKIDPLQVVKVNITWQNRYEDGLVRAQSRGTIRDAVSQYRVEEVVSTKRVDMIKQVTDTLSKKLSDNGFVLDDFVLRNITFSPEYAASVEQKQIAEQQAQQAKFVVESKKQEAEQARQVAQGQADAIVINAKGAAESRIIQAQAEAQALELLAKAIENKADLLTYTYINKLTPGIQVMLLPSNSPFIFPLPQYGPQQAGTAVNPTSILPTPLPTPVPVAPQPTPRPTPRP